MGPRIHRQLRELAQFPDENSAITRGSGKGRKLRAFRMSSLGDTAMQQYFPRHHKLLGAYKGAHPGTSTIPRSAFVAWAKQQDPYFVLLGRSLVPSLYFDFVGNSTQYVLDQISVRTIRFEEYSGGGFFDANSWYDIELSTLPGVRNVNVGKRLRFTGSGRTEITFFSSNYYPNAAMTPQGSFTIELSFHFSLGAERCTTRTGPFMLDA